MLQLNDCEVGINVNGVKYEFDHVDTVTTDDPQTTSLVRGQNGTSKTGIAVKDGLDTPETITCTLKGISGALFIVMRDCYRNKTRVDFWCIEKSTGARISANNCVFNQEPKQKTITTGAETVTTDILLQTFDRSDKYITS